MKLFISTLALQPAMVGFALAQQPTKYDDTLCSDLRTQALHYLDPEPLKDFQLYDTQSPMMVPIDAAMEGLDGEAYARIRAPLIDLVMSACINPNTYTKRILKDHGLQDNPTFGQAMTAILDFLELNPSKPNWGLVELPHMDFSKMTMDEVMLSFENLPVAFLNGNPVNNIWAYKFRKYWSRYDLSTQGSVDKVHKIMASLSFGIEDSETETMKNILDRLADAEGLERK